MGYVLLFIGAIIALVGTIIFLVAAFSEHIGWGLACIFLPFASLIFLVMHWHDAKKGFFLSLAGTVIVMIGIALLPETTPAALTA